jgi:hypothetical protein
MVKLKHKCLAILICQGHTINNHKKGPVHIFKYEDSFSLSFSSQFYLKELFTDLSIISYFSPLKLTIFCDFFLVL